MPSSQSNLPTRIALGYFHHKAIVTHIKKPDDLQSVANHPVF
ncbi:hypothetical protein ANHS_322 [Ligilactobacillus ruminis ATCC 25644]|nr:hypothetical protein ANHS_322 [Ligilactobacillus ruminis ATCC 25644]